MLEFISQPWHWFPSGVGIVTVMFLLLISGRKFGVSSNFRTICAIGGAGKHADFFKFDWKDQTWGLVFILGAVIGGFIGLNVIGSPEPVQIAQSTQDYLTSVGIKTPQTLNEGYGFVPHEIYGSQNFDIINLLFLIIGGFLIGFGTRYAGGCTSGHAISGLSNLQLPSLIAVIGFFAGGLLMSWIILPKLLILI